MLKKIFISAILLLAVLSFVVSLLKGNNNGEKTVNLEDRIAVVTIEGTIASSAGGGSSPFGGSEGVTSGSIMAQIREAAQDKSVKALVLRINSGGGSATAAEEISRELLRFKNEAKKPIVASLGNSGASAAYWIAACASDKIYANATTLTGSIGVFMPYMNGEELFKKIGITTDKIKSGPYKDIMSYDRPMTPEERLILQTLVDEIYNEFITVVAAGRKMDVVKVRELADGRVYSGAQALRLGLVDEIGNYYDALQAAGTMAGVKPGNNGLPPVKEPERVSTWEMLLGAQVANVVSSQLTNNLGNLLQGEAALKVR